MNLVGNDKIDLDNYKNKVIVTRVKENLEKELFTRLATELKGIVTIEEVIVNLDSNYQMQEIVVTIKEKSLPLVEMAIDKIIAEYNLPSSMLRIIAKGE
ncbi:MAG: hypothetical protein IKV94_01280 [Clostridia bacterium]|nr:hypothetical protein [Clostridia bacterium]